MASDDGAVGAGVIHDIGYQRYAGPRLGRRHVVTALYLHSLRTAFGLGRSANAKIFPWIVVGLAFAGRPWCWWRCAARPAGSSRSPTCSSSTGWGSRSLCSWR